MSSHPRNLKRVQDRSDRGLDPQSGDERFAREVGFIGSLAVVSGIDATERPGDLAGQGEEQFRLLTQRAGVGVGYYSVDGTALFFNDVAAELMGKRPSEVVGRSVTDLFEQPQSLEFLSRIRSIAATGETTSYEDQVPLPSGRRSWFLSTYSRVADFSDTVLGVQVLSVDITERKEAEQKLGESEERFFKAFNANPAMSSIAEIETGCLIEVNDAWLQTLGFTREDVIGRSVVELGIISRDERAALIAASADSLPGLGVEVRLGTKTRNKVTVLWTGELVEFDGKKCLLATAIDISDRKAMEESLLLTQFSVDRAAEAIFWFAHDGLILYANRGASELYGYSPEELLSMTVFDLDPDLSHESWREGWDSRSEETAAFYVRPRKKNGDRFFAEVTAGYLRHGGRCQCFSFIRDVTEHREAEEALCASEHRFRQMFESMSSGVAVYDAIDGGADFLIAEFNPAAERITSASREDVVGLSIGKAFPGVRTLGLYDVIERVWRTGLPEALPAARYDDGRLALWVENFVYKLPSGEIFAMFDDVTEKQQTFQELRGAYDQLRFVQGGTLQALGAMTEFRDPYTAGHQQRVARVAVSIARQMGLSEDRLEGLRAAATVHDIGKIGVPIEILSSPAQLSPLQLDIVRQHATSGYEILKTIKFDWPVAEIVRQHHERLDGSGYPRGLGGEEILLEARILCVADMLEAMVSHRPYRPALGMETALEELMANRGVLYDSAVVDALMEIDVGSVLDADRTDQDLVMWERPGLLAALD